MKRLRITSPSVFLQKGRAPRVYILPTRYGYVFACGLAAMLIGSMNYKSNLSFLFTFLLAGIFLVSMIHTHRNLSGITLRSADAQPVFAGDTVEFELVVNTARPRTAVTFSLPGGDEITCDIPPGRAAGPRLRAEASGRGIFSPGPVTIATVYPLGLFRAWRRSRLVVESLVYPRPVRGPWRTSDGSSDHGPEGDGAGAGGDDFQGLRQYVPGDSLRHIAWKSYSREQGLFTKRFEGPGGGTVVFDWHHLGGGDTEQRLSLLCDLVLRAHRRGLGYGLTIPGTVIPAASGVTHMRVCLRALALYDAGDTVP